MVRVVKGAGVDREYIRLMGSHSMAHVGPYCYVNPRCCGFSQMIAIYDDLFWHICKVEPPPSLLSSRNLSYPKHNSGCNKEFRWPI